MIIQFPTRPGVPVPPSTKYTVIPHEGRFVVGRRIPGTMNEYTAVTDCRTERFAQAHAAALNSGQITEGV